MFLKRERPETDDSAINKNLVVKAKYEMLFTCVRHPYKKNQKMSLHILNFAEHSEHFLFFSTKTYIFLADKGPPFNGHVCK